MSIALQVSTDSCVSRIKCDSILIVLIYNPSTMAKKSISLPYGLDKSWFLLKECKIMIAWSHWQVTLLQVDQGSVVNLAAQQIKCHGCHWMHWFYMEKHCSSKCLDFFKADSAWQRLDVWSWRFEPWSYLIRPDTFSSILSVWPGLLICHHHWKFLISYLNLVWYPRL